MSQITTVFEADGFYDIKYAIVDIPNDRTAVDTEQNKKHKGPCVCVHFGPHGSQREWVKDAEEALKVLGEKKASVEVLARAAVAVGMSTPQADVPDAPDGAGVDLDAMTVKNLRALAKERNVDLGKARKKADIIAVLEAD